MRNWLLNSPLVLILSAFFYLTPIKWINADQLSIQTQVQQEINELGPIYRVIAPNKALSKKAAISFHANLLESDTTSATHIMSLNAEEKQKLERFGFKIISHPQWAEKYRQQRMLFLQSKQSEAEIESETNLQAAAQQGIDNYPCYPTVEETFQQASALAAANPTLASWIDIGDSWEKTAGNGGYDLMVLKISNSAISADKPILFIHSAMHAREYTTAALTLEFANQLLNQYGTNADLSWIVDWHEVHILFHMNPDGRKKAEQGLSWRKNTNQNYCGTTSNNRGADLNRNFTHFWNITNGEGSSSNQCNATYRGPVPNSEPETQAVQNYIRSLFSDNRGPNDNDPASADTTGIHLDIHSYSELILWPYGHTANEAPNASALQTLGRKLAFYNGYSPEQSIGLYPTDGTSDSVSYGELGVPAFTFELGTAFFQNCSTYENTIKPDNLPALIYAAKVVRAPYRLPAGPEVHSLTLNGQDNASVIQGSSVALSASANDSRYQNSNGTEPRQNIIQAEYYLDIPPWEDTATANPMSPADGNFNSFSETINASIDTSTMNLGKHAVFVRARDANGQWGAVSSGFITVSDTPINQPPSAPGNLTAEKVVQGKGKKATIISITLNWQDNSINEDGFVVERCVESGKGKNKVCNFSQLATVPANITDFQDPAPVNNARYRVKAYNLIGDSAYSNIVQP